MCLCVFWVFHFMVVICMAISLGVPRWFTYDHGYAGLWIECHYDDSDHHTDTCTKLHSTFVQSMKEANNTSMNGTISPSTNQTISQSMNETISGSVNGTRTNQARTPDWYYPVAVTISVGFGTILLVSIVSCILACCVEDNVCCYVSVVVIACASVVVAACLAPYAVLYQEVVFHEEGPPEGMRLGWAFYLMAFCVSTFGFEAVVLVLITCRCGGTGSSSSSKMPRIPRTPRTPRTPRFPRLPRIPRVPRAPRMPRVPRNTARF